MKDHSGVNILAWVIIIGMILSAIPFLIPWIIVFALEGGFVFLGWLLLAGFAAIVWVIWSANRRTP